MLACATFPRKVCHGWRVLPLIVPGMYDGCNAWVFQGCLSAPKRLMAVAVQGEAHQRRQEISRKTEVFETSI